MWESCQRGGVLLRVFAVNSDDGRSRGRRAEKRERPLPVTPLPLASHALAKKRKLEVSG